MTKNWPSWAGLGSYFAFHLRHDINVVNVMSYSVMFCYVMFIISMFVMSSGVMIVMFDHYLHDLHDIQGKTAELLLIPRPGEGWKG